MRKDGQAPTGSGPHHQITTRRFAAILFHASMPIEHRPLVTEFPEHRDAIHALKLKDNHFSRLMDEYEETDKEIFRMEEGIETPEDAVMNEMKK